MALQAQVDYDALADKARGKVAPAPKKAAAVDYDSLADQARQSASVSSTSSAPTGPSYADLTTNSVDPATGKGYGLYRMGSYDFNEGQVTKPEIQVPYNRVQDAAAAGYKLHPDETARYQNDTAHNGRVAHAATYVKDLLSRMTEPMADTPVEGNAWQKANAAMFNVEKLPFNVVNRTARGVVGLPQGVIKGAIDFTQGDPSGVDPFAMAENSYKGWQQDTDTLGPMAALGNLGGDATTMYLAGKAGAPVAEAGTKAMLDVTNRARNFPEATIRAMTNTGSGPIKKLVNDTQVANEDIGKTNVLADQNHKTDTQNALHDQQGKDIGYQQDVASKAQEISQADQSEAASLTARQRLVNQKIADANKAVQAKHQAVAQRVQAANQAAENMLDLRRQHEQAYQQATDAHYTKENAADVRGKAEENSAWSAWRQKIAGKTLDGGQIVEPLQRIAALSPETAQFLRKLQGSPEDAPMDSLYAQDRAAIMKAQGYKGGYFDYPAPIRAQIDRIAASSGFEPDPIDFDPQAGKPIPIEQVHRASSILQGYIREGRFNGNGPLRGEMKQLAKVLRAAVTRASAEAGAAPELDSARNATITYQGAFGREIKPQTTARTIREKQINPEAFQTREDEARLAKTRSYDPTLVDSYRQVKAAREALDKLPDEESLRKKLRQVPAPPTVGDARPGFRLVELPKPAPARLTSGSPSERAAQAVKPPDRSNFPDRPSPTPNKTISASDIAGAYRAAADTRIGKIENRGQWAATWPLFQAARALWGGHIPSIPTMGLESAGMLATVKATTKLLRYPPLIKFLEQARPEDLASIPPELRGDLPGLVEQAKQRGIKVSPALVAATAGVAGQQNRQPSFTPAQAIQAMQPAGAIQ